MRRAPLPFEAARKRRAFVSWGAVAALLLIAGVATAQAPVDFTGAWSAAGGGGRSGGGGGRGGADPSAAMGSGWGDDITIVQRDGMLTVERIFFSRGDLQPALRLRCALDGTPTANVLLMGRGMQESTCTAEWREDALLLTTIETVGAPSLSEPINSQVQRRLTLQSPSSLVGMPSLLIETTFEGVLGGPPTTTRTVYTPR